MMNDPRASVPWMTPGQRTAAKLAWQASVVLLKLIRGRPLRFPTTSDSMRSP